MIQESICTLVQASASSTNPQVLVVDDEPAFCTVVCEILKAYGYETYQALSARHAMSLLAELTPDLILTDIMMPEVDGLSMIRRLRSVPSWSGIPTVVLSAKSDPEDLHAAFEAGADACLPKPFSAQELWEMVTRFVPN